MAQLEVSREKEGEERQRVVVGGNGSGPIHIRSDGEDLSVGESVVRQLYVRHQRRYFRHVRRGDPYRIPNVGGQAEYLWLEHTVEYHRYFDSPIDTVQPFRVTLAQPVVEEMGHVNTLHINGAEDDLALTVKA